MQNEILRIWEVEKTTMILVTHDIDEAIYLADRIAVLGSKPGVVRHVYDVDLPRTRSRGDVGFDSLRHKLWDAIFQPSASIESVPQSTSATNQTSDGPMAKPQYSVQ